MAVSGAPTIAGATSVAPTGDNLISVHSQARSHAEQCTSCHGDRKQELGTDGKTKTSHALHLSSPLLKFSCVFCHPTVDLRQGSAATLRKQVSPELCASCHSAWPEAKMHTEKTREMCVQCHADWKEAMAGTASYVALDRITASDCYGCHGGRTLYARATKHEHAGDRDHG
jgi:hypothetical protein